MSLSHSSSPSADPSHSDLLQVALLLHGLTRDLTTVVGEPLGDGLTTNQAVQVFLRIHREPGITPTGLARALGMSNSAVSRLLAPMEAASVVAGRPDREDARVVHLRLTRAGRRRVAAFERRLRRHFVEHETVTKEALSLLGAPVPDPTVERAVSPLVALEELVRAGAACVRDVKAAIGEDHVGEWSERFALLLLRLKPMQPRELADHLGLSSSGVHDLVNRLEVRGLARRRADRMEDGRAVLVELTDSGATHAEAEITVIGTHAASLAAGLGPMMTFGIDGD